MQYRILVSTLVSIMCLLASFTAADIVKNSSGKLVKLNEDFTWELVDLSSESGRVVFNVSSGEDHYKSYVKKDDFGNVKKINHYFGCTYNVTISNNTDHAISVGYFELRLEGLDKGAFIILKETIPPQTSIETHDHFDKTPLRSLVTETKKPLTDDETAAMIKKFGCKAQSGEVYIQRKREANWYFLKFDPSSGIADDVVLDFVVTSENGVYPLQKQIR